MSLPFLKNTGFLTVSFSCCPLRLEIVTPYFCFYEGSVLITKVKDAQLKSKPEEKNQLLGDYCEAMGSKALKARLNLIDKTLH